MARTRAPAGLEPAAEAWSLIGELFQAHARPRWSALAAELDLSPPQATALLRLGDPDGMPMRQLACALHCDNSNVTGIVDRLEDRGLVERRVDAADRRVKRIVLTPDGAALRDAVRARLAQPPAPLRRLTAAEQRELRDLMRRALDR
ncbi:MAG TPA: MarR family transcriptional regulator [Solirubrobacteraceae bacterium]|nr:MarR family transcriptional regulator [Solirubrobacteraceae bacterium]